MSERLAIPGKPMPTMTLPATDATDARIGGGGTWQMVVVYRGRHCPLCRKYLKVLGGLADDFKSIGVDVVAVSGDPRDRAREEAAEEGWAFPVACELSLDQMRTLGLYISEPRSAQETDRPFPEPGLFITNPDGILQIVDVSNAPFSRPDLHRILGGLRFIQEKNYPIRGTAA
jgi:peroxiredoxin